MGKTQPNTRTSVKPACTTTRQATITKVLITIQMAGLFMPLCIA